MPLVRARMATINGESVKDREYPTPGGRWMANREANLSWATTLSSSNEVIDGQWWPQNYDGPPLVSIEEDAAIDTGLVVGDIMTFRIAGRELEATISSIRKINWDSFQPNFFFVFVCDSMRSGVRFSSSLYAPTRASPLLTSIRYCSKYAASSKKPVSQCRRCSYLLWPPGLPFCLPPYSRRLTKDASKARCYARSVHADAQCSRA